MMNKEERKPTASMVAKQIYELIYSDLSIYEQIKGLVDNVVNEGLVDVDFNKTKFDELNKTFQEANKKFDETYINKDDPIALKEAGLVKVEDLGVSFNKDNLILTVEKSAMKGMGLRLIFESEQKQLVERLWSKVKERKLKATEALWILGDFKDVPIDEE